MGGMTSSLNMAILINNSKQCKKDKLNKENEEKQKNKENEEKQKNKKNKYSKVKLDNDPYNKNELEKALEKK